MLLYQNTTFEAWFQASNDNLFDTNARLWKVHSDLSGVNSARMLLRYFGQFRTKYFEINSEFSKNSSIGVQNYRLIKFILLHLFSSSFESVLIRILYDKNTENSRKQLKTVFLQKPSEALRDSDLKSPRNVGKKSQYHRQYAGFCWFYVKIDFKTVILAAFRRFRNSWDF